MTPEDAEHYLREFPEFTWLTDVAPDFWYKITEVAASLRLGEAVVRNACARGDISGAINYGPRIGWRMPRRGLLLYCATKKQQSMRRG